VTALKKLTEEGVGSALRKAERCRFLGEPLEAESICQDILAIQPENHAARILRILALTDQFQTDLGRMPEARELAGSLAGEYERCYYLGVVAERQGKTQLSRGGPGSDDAANRALREAMAWYEKAEALSPTGEDEAILRWNTCSRAIQRRGFQVPSDMARSPLFMTE
jgi:hypothetical protein